MTQSSWPKGLLWLNSWYLFHFLCLCLTLCPSVSLYLPLVCFSWHQQNHPESHCPLITNRKGTNILNTSINIIRIRREVSDLIWNGNSEFAQGWNCSSANIEFVFLFSCLLHKQTHRDETEAKWKYEKIHIWHKYNSRYWRFLLYTHCYAEHGDTCVCVWSSSLFSREYGIQQPHQMINDTSMVCRICGVILRCYRSCHGKTLTKKNSDEFFLCQFALRVIGEEPNYRNTVWRTWRWDFITGMRETRLP